MRFSIVGIVLLSLGCSRPSNDHGTPSGGSPPALVVNLSIVATNPPNLQLGVDRAQVFTVTFSKPVSTLTVNPATVLFTSPYGPVAGSLAVLGAQVSFTPTQALPASVEIVGTVTKGVKGIGGESMALPHSWSFRVENGPEVIASGPLLKAPRVAVSAGGLVMVMYAQWTASGERLFARHYLPSTGWNEIVEIPVNASPVGYHFFEVKCTNDNEAVAAWSEGGPSWPVTLRTARFVNGQGWQAPETLLATVQGSVSFDVHPLGHGAVSAGSGGGGGVLRRLSPDGAWEAPLLQPFHFKALSDTGELFEAVYGMIPSIGVGPFGVNRYIFGSGQSGEILGGYAGYTMPTVAADTGGEAVAAVATATNLLSWRFSGNAWTALPSIPFVGNSITYDFKLGPSGDGALVWHQWAGSFYTIVATGFDAAQGFAGVTSLNPSGMGAGWPSLAVTGSGTSWVVWDQSNGTRECIYRATYVPGGGWSVAVLDEGNLNAWEPRVSAMESNRAAAWYRDTDSSTREIMATILD